MGLIEALSYGLPSVVTRGSNMLKEIKEADAGWVAEIDAISIAQALKKMVIENDKFVIKVITLFPLQESTNGIY